MTADNKPRDQGASNIYASDGYPDILSAAPACEDWITQLGPGKMQCNARAINNASASLIAMWEKPLCVGGTVLKPDRIGLLIPRRWDGDYIIDGYSMAPDQVYIVDSRDGFIQRGKNRHFYGLTVKRDMLLASLGALLGVPAEDVTLGFPVLQLPAGVGAALADRLQAILDHHDLLDLQCTSKPRYKQTGFDECIYREFLNQLILRVGPTIHKRRTLVQARRIVRLAEERFEQAGGQPVSLADLCIATGVSSTSLYDAFGRIVGAPPLKHFSLRRINLAHNALAQSAYRRGAVTHIANSYGFSELGRFARDYRSIFGVSPSATLRSSKGAGA